VHAYVAVTDGDWFHLLAELAPKDEVNFWRPSPRGFRSLEPGEVLLFKLHHPQNFIVGGGFFARYEVYPCGWAWDAFHERNGVTSLDDMIRRIGRYRRGLITETTDIGCVMLEQPFFFERDVWIPAPADFAKNIVSGKRYDLRERSDVWEAVQMRLLDAGTPDIPDADADVTFTRAWVNQRQGQGTFKAAVTSAYARRCAVTGEKILPVLQAAHIRPVTQQGPHRVDNGLLLRSDVHTLFDRGYLTLAPDLALMVSPRLHSDFENGAYYYELAGQEIRKPERVEEQPRGEFLEWHRDVVFKAS
jgi:putative restriction endonuclease